MCGPQIGEVRGEDLARKENNRLSFNWCWLSGPGATGQGLGIKMIRFSLLGKLTLIIRAIKRSSVREQQLLASVRMVWRAVGLGRLFKVRGMSSRKCNFAPEYHSAIGRFGRKI